ncbi:hypothetical protein SDC9_184022 [bioreactor metagenome]|uniref:Uncharacterized protein n=1 Tax=bioreactor metagenome TaxID=1076179 RepID=A0A645HLK4_9ZZZZ
MLTNGGNEGIEHHGHQSTRKTVVVEIHARQGAARGQHHRGVEEAGQDTIEPAKKAGDGGQGGAE